MTLIPTEAKVEAGAQAQLPGEQVLAAGLFQPHGSGVSEIAGADAAHELTEAVHLPGAAGAVADVAGVIAGQRGAAAVNHQPPFTAIAVTDARIYAFDATADGGMAARTDYGAPYRVWDRAAVAVHVTRYPLSFTLTLDDTQTGERMRFKGNRLYKVGGKLVAHLLADAGHDGD